VTITHFLAGNVAAHGVPDDRPLEDGDVVNIDVSVYLDGFHGDCAETFLVGNGDSASRGLVSAARECLFQGIGACGPGEPIRKIGHAIHHFAKRRRVNPIPVLCGHGIGAYFHGPPDVYHALNSYPGLQQPGMVFTIEPCVSEGSKAVRILDDGFTVVTLDGSRTAQFEHTVLITEVGLEILTA
jgi:methionyl aminopeptidase